MSLLNKYLAFSDFSDAALFVLPSSNSSSYTTLIGAGSNTQIPNKVAPSNVAALSQASLNDPNTPNRLTIDFNSGKIDAATYNSLMAQYQSQSQPIPTAIPKARVVSYPKQAQQPVTMPESPVSSSSSSNNSQILATLGNVLQTAASEGSKAYVAAQSAKTARTLANLEAKGKINAAMRNNKEAARPALAIVDSPFKPSGGNFTKADQYQQYIKYGLIVLGVVAGALVIKKLVGGGSSRYAEMEA